MSKIAVADATGEVVSEVDTDYQEVGIEPRGRYVLLQRQVETEVGGIHLTEAAAESLADKYGYEVLAVGRKVKDVEPGDRVMLMPGAKAIVTPNKGQVLVDHGLITGFLYDLLEDGEDEDDPGEVVFEG